MTRRQHNRNPYWAAQYRHRKLRLREMDRLLREFYMPGLITVLNARVLLDLPEADPRHRGRPASAFFVDEMPSTPEPSRLSTLLSYGPISGRRRTASLTNVTEA